MWVFHSCLHRSPAVINFNENCSFQFLIWGHFWEYLSCCIFPSPVLQLTLWFPRACHYSEIEVNTRVVGVLHFACFVVHMVQLWCNSDEDKHSNVLQFGIDPSILLVGSMPKQLMQPAIDYPVSCLAEFHSDVTLFSESQVCQMASTSFLYVLSFYSASVDFVFKCVCKKVGGWLSE